jgi:anti-sigma B factor antagonist
MNDRVNSFTRTREAGSVRSKPMSEFPHPTFAVVEEDLDDHTRILVASGEIHVSTAPELSVRLHEAISAGRTRIVLDFGGVEFIDSTGLSVLLNALRRLSREDGSLSLVCTNPTVLRLFEITRLDATFDIFETREQALEHIGVKVQS